MAAVALLAHCRAFLGCPLDRGILTRRPWPRSRGAIFRTARGAGGRLPGTSAALCLARATLRRVRATLEYMRPALCESAQRRDPGGHGRPFEIPVCSALSRAHRPLSEEPPAALVHPHRATQLLDTRTTASRRSRAAPATRTRCTSRERSGNCMSSARRDTARRGASASSREDSLA